MTVRFTVYGAAQAAGSKRYIGQGRVVDANPNAKEWQRQVAQEAGAVFDGSPLLDGPLELTLTFYRPRPAGHYGKRGLRPAAPEFPTTRPDVLKLARAVEDALTGVIFRDDSQVVTETITKHYGEPARVEILVETLEESEAA